jgi:hypothetical protein
VALELNYESLFASLVNCENSKGNMANVVNINAGINYGILEKVLNDLEHYHVSDIAIIFQEFSILGSQV